MFSNNGEISNHQTTRLLILDVFTGAVLFLPGTLARICGSGGLTALILGLLLTLADGALLAWSFRRCRQCPTFRRWDRALAGICSVGFTASDALERLFF